MNATEIISRLKNAPLIKLQFLLPPVHPHCRCYIDQATGEWLDADRAQHSFSAPELTGRNVGSPAASVCVRCRVLGAAFNLAQEGQISDDQADDLLDVVNDPDLIKRLKDDEGFRNVTIRRVAEMPDRGGIAKSILREAGDPQDAMARMIANDLAAAREAADVQARLREISGIPQKIPQVTVGAGVQVQLPPPKLTPAVPVPPPQNIPIEVQRQIFPLREAVTTERRQGAVKPVFVKVDIKIGNKAKVYWRAGKIMVADIASGRVKKTFDGADFAGALIYWQGLEAR